MNAFEGFHETHVRADVGKKHEPKAESTGDMAMLSGIPEHTLQILRDSLASSSHGDLSVFERVEAGDQFGYDEGDQAKIKSLLEQLRGTSPEDRATIARICASIIAALG